MNNSVELAIEVCRTLFNAGYTAYFAGGFVRDLILKTHSDEIDIATNAPPEAIQKLFSKTIPVGIAFGVVIVVLEGKQFEVTTFRKDHPYHDGRHPDGVDFSTAEKDAQRRDFTINGMFYDPLTETLFDYVGGQEDLKKKIIRAIGDPTLRFHEDRLRMLRAVRFAARLNFKIEKQTEKAIIENAPSLFPSVSMERIYQEFEKMRPLDRGLIMLHKLQLLPVIFPYLKELREENLSNYIAPFKYFPSDTPTIIFLMELFPHLSLSEKLDLCHYLKTSKKEWRLVEFFFHAGSFFKKKEVHNAAWAHFYADERSSLFLEIEAAKILPPERIHFLQEHEKRRESLLPHIERIKQHKPLVDAAMLQKNGIKKGKELGALLKEAEKIAINQNLHRPDDILEILKTSPLWPR